MKFSLRNFGIKKSYLSDSLVPKKRGQTSVKFSVASLANFRTFRSLPQRTSGASAMTFRSHFVSYDETKQRVIDAYVSAANDKDVEMDELKVSLICAVSKRPPSGRFLFAISNTLTCVSD